MMAGSFVEFNFLGLPPVNSSREEARYSIVPVAYEGTVTYGAGTKFGPAAIIAASREVETYDAVTGIDLADIGICTLPEVAAVATGPEQMVARVEQVIAAELDAGRTPIMLGGEHSLTTGAVRAYRKKFPGLSVLQFDAHLDLRDAYQGSPYSHASAMRRVREICSHVCVGARNCSAEEKEFIEREGVPVFWARDVIGRNDWYDRCLEHLTKDVYVTFDLDGFDPAVMPAVGTPEPGGLGWYDALDFLQYASTKKNIVGADIVELAPIPGLLYPDFTAAQLTAALIRMMDAGSSVR
jgi:agmatinase